MEVHQMVGKIQQRNNFVEKKFIKEEEGKYFHQTLSHPLLLLFLTVRPEKELAAIRSVQPEDEVPLCVVVCCFNACLR